MQRVISQGHGPRPFLLVRGPDRAISSCQILNPLSAPESLPASRRPRALHIERRSCVTAVRVDFKVPSP